MIVGYLARESPRLPAHGPGTVVARLAAAVLLQSLAVSTLYLLRQPAASPKIAATLVHADDEDRITLPRLVFVAPPRVSVPGGGGGGGGNRQPGPIRRAQGIGHDSMTLRVAKPINPPDHVPEQVPELSPLPALTIDARPLASGTFDQVGLPQGGVSYGISTGPGSGGGVGTGTGTGIGPGRGPGVGPGTGGGTGGGFYRPGGGVTPPRLLSEAKPRYTNEALRSRIEGSVWLELIVTPEGLPSNVRIVRSLDPGLDREAVDAVMQWRFAPGRLAGEPVHVLVSVVLDFHVR